MSRSTDDNTPHPLDIALGARVRLRRKELGLSQAQLGRAVGITFQQVQKYEHGTNRISFSRLVEISHALDWSAADLIGPLNRSKSSKILGRQTDALDLPGAAELLAAYAGIASRPQRRAILNFARQLRATISGREVKS